MGSGSEPDAAVEVPLLDRLIYEGDDTGFAELARRRVIDQFEWTPRHDVIVDLSGCEFRLILLRVDAVDVGLTLPTCQQLVLQGDLSHVDLIAQIGAELPHIVVDTDPLGPPIDCRELARFTGLAHLELRGNVSHLESLAELDLQSIQLRFVPDLTGFPPLTHTTWPRLTSFIAWNVEQTVGRRLQRELAAVRQPEGWGYSSVGKLRSAAWFLTEYGTPFAGWPARTARAAGKAFATAAKAVEKSSDTAGALAALTTFVTALNHLPGLETGERDDAGDAVALLAALAPDRVDAEQAQQLFDAVREF